MDMNFPVWHWHIENSSICSLRCPRCPRQEVAGNRQTSLNLEFFSRNFNEQMIKDVWQITFCGDDGDPIYGQDFLQIITYLKTLKPNLSIRIVTNGSYKSVEWWYSLGKVLNQYDDIHFSLDGWDQQSNEKYRKNSNWDSIVNGIKILRFNTAAIMTWAAIGFRFNENNIDDMKLLATELGFDKFQLTKSTKFGNIYPHYYQDGDDLLEPHNLKLIAKGRRFEREIFDLTDRKQLENSKSAINDVLWQTIDKTKSIIPMCKIGNKGLYISADGYFYPCCWMANRYDHTRWEQFKQPQFNLNQRSIVEVLSDNHWHEFFATLNKNRECSDKCAEPNFNRDYATSW
jgi:MoaA/NifB/PqqE/SkfB family radical SAM enzyme